MNANCCCGWCVWEQNKMRIEWPIYSIGIHQRVRFVFVTNSARLSGLQPVWAWYASTIYYKVTWKSPSRRAGCMSPRSDLLFWPAKNASHFWATREQWYSTTLPPTLPTPKFISPTCVSLISSLYRAVYSQTWGSRSQAMPQYVSEWAGLILACTL